MGGNLTAFFREFVLFCLFVCFTFMHVHWGKEGCAGHSVRGQRSEDSLRESSVCFDHVGSRECRLSGFAESTFTLECQPQQCVLMHLDHASKSWVVGGWREEVGGKMEF